VANPIVTPDLVTELSQYDWENKEVFIEVERITPRTTRDGVPCSGVLPGRIYRSIDVNYLAEHFGGQRYTLHVYGPDATDGRVRRYATINNINVAAGDPKLTTSGLPRGPAEPALTPQDQSMSSGPAIERLADKMVTQASRNAEESRRAALNAEHELHVEKQRMLDTRLEEVQSEKQRIFDERATRPNDTGALEVLQRQAAEQTRAQTEMMKLMAHRGDAEQGRQLSMFQAMIVAMTTNQKPVQDTSMVDTWREELRTARDAHAQQLAALREESRDRLEAIRAENERVAREGERLHSLQLETLKKQVEGLERDTREAREAERKLRDDLHTSRAEALEAKIRASVGDRDINSTLATVAKAKSLVEVFNGNSTKTEPDTLTEKIFGFISSDTGSNLINSVGSRLKAQVEQRQAAPVLPPAPAPDYQSMAAWQEWQQRHTIAGRPGVTTQPITVPRSHGVPVRQRRPVAPPTNVAIPQPLAIVEQPTQPVQLEQPHQDEPLLVVVDEQPSAVAPEDTAIHAMLSQLASYLENAAGTDADPAITYNNLLPQLDLAGVSRELFEKTTADDVIALFDNASVSLGMATRAYIRAMFASRQLSS
jgi:hypothetical protein